MMGARNDRASVASHGRGLARNVMGIELERGSDSALGELVVTGMVQHRDSQIEITKLGHETLRDKTEKAIVDYLKWIAGHPSSDIIC